MNVPIFILISYVVLLGIISWGASKIQERGTGGKMLNYLLAGQQLPTSLVAVMLTGLAVAQAAPPDPAPAIREHRQKIEHLQQASRQLKQAGLDQQAAELNRQAEKLRQHIDQRVRQARAQQAAEAKR